MNMKAHVVVCVPLYWGGGCLPRAHLARYFCVNYPDFNPGFTKGAPQADQSGPQRFPTKHAA